MTTPSDSFPVGVDRLTLTIYGADASVEILRTVDELYAEIHAATPYYEGTAEVEDFASGWSQRMTQPTFGSWWHDGPTNLSGSPLSPAFLLHTHLTAGLSEQRITQFVGQSQPFPSGPVYDLMIRPLVCPANCNEEVERPRRGLRQETMVVGLPGAGVILKLLDNPVDHGSRQACYAPSATAARMVRAVCEDSGAVLPVCAWVDGEYGISGVYLGVPPSWGARGCAGWWKLR